MMIRPRTIAAITLSLAFAGPAFSAAEGSKRGEFYGAMTTEHPGWFKESFLDFSQDIREAAANGKRVVVYVYQDGCPYCNRLVQHNFGQKDIYEKTRENFEVIALNMWGDREVTIVDGATMTEKQFAKAIGVNYTPTLVFFDEQGNVALRLDGYYPPHNMRIALDYVAGKHDKDLKYAEFYAKHSPQPASGELHREPFFSEPPYDLARSPEKPAARPVAVLFEQKQCEHCDYLHEKILTVPETRDLARQLTIVQLDLWSDTPVVTPQGKTTNAREWARELGVAFAPAFVFYDRNGKEVMRIDGHLKNFHTQSVFDYVLTGAYDEQPEFQRYLSERAEHLRDQGKDVNIWE
jgi:thioredoxin-related protein